MIVNVLTLLLFVAAWLIANVLFEILKAYLARKSHLKLVDDVYLKVSKLLMASMKELKEVAKHGNL